MTDTVTTHTTEDGPRYHVIHIQNLSDGTGESAVQKVDISTLLGPDGKVGLAPSRFAIKSCRWDVQGFTSVQVLFDATTDDEALTLSGNGYDEFDPPIQDPQSTGTTGDIRVTTNGAINGASYDITLTLIKKQ